MMHSTATTPGSSSSEGLERYVSGIETDEGLARLAENVSANHDRIPILCAVVWPRRRFTASYAGASEIVLERLRTIGQESGQPAGKSK